MKTIFNVKISKFTTINELPNAWTNQDFIALLDAMEYGDTTQIPPSDLKEMCMMYVTDYQPNEAAKIVLDYKFENSLNNGQKDNLSHEIIEEKMWEEYADLSFHETFFNVGQFLYHAYNGKFPQPEAVTFNLTIAANKPSELDIFKDKNEATILRLLAKAMPSNTLINRLYKAQLEGEVFTEAKDILWQIKNSGIDGNSINFQVISSLYWFHDLKFVDTFEASTHKDEVLIQD